MNVSCLDQYCLDKYTSLKSEYLQALAVENITTVTEFLQQTPDSIMLISMMDHMEYEQFVNEVFAKCRPQSFSLAAAALSKPSSITTGIKFLDEALGGGLARGDILELCGQSGAGKSQICHVVAAQLCHKHEFHVAYLDAKNDFYPLRFYELCEGSDKSLGKLCIYRGSKIKSVDRTLQLIERKLRAGDSAFGEDLRLIIIDSLPSIFYPLINEQDDSPRILQERFTQSIRRLAVIYNLTVIVTNHAVIDHKDYRPKSEPSSSEFSKQLKPALGQYWLSVPNTRILLSKRGNSSVFLAEVSKNCRPVEHRMFEFQISHLGIS